MGGDDDIPEAWREGAEEIRAHLCALRGGAPFLSPADALQVFTWLEAGVPVPRVLLALERAAEARRASRSRFPLTVVAAKRHLGRPSASAVEPVAADGEPPLAAVVRALDHVPRSELDAGHRESLAAALLAIDAPGEDAQRAALAAARTFFEAVWAGAPPQVRAAWVTEAELELGDLLGLVDEATRAALVEETARDRVRAAYPALTAATFAALLDTSAP